MSRHFVFKDQGYWTSNGCDCCEPMFWNCYNCDELPFIGSQSSIIDIKEALIREVVRWEEEDEEVLDKILGLLGVTYEIKEEE